MLYTCKHNDKKPDIPLFRMKIIGKEVDTLFDTGSTVNNLDYKNLVNHLEIPKQFIQNKSTGIRVITGQKVSNIGKVQLQTELLNYKSAKSFVVLPTLTFPAQALISYKSMKKWGVILDCEKEEITLDAESPHDCFQLEDERSPSNLINLTETTSQVRNTCAIQIPRST